MTPEELAEDIALRLAGHPTCAWGPDYTDDSAEPQCQRPASHPHSILCKHHFEVEKAEWEAMRARLQFRRIRGLLLR